MIPRPISSLQHPLIKRLAKLRESRVFRKQEKSVLLVGKTVIEEVALHCRLKTLISEKPLSLKADSHYLATPPAIQKIIGLKTDDLVAAEVVIPPSSSLTKARLILFLDQVGDPGNVGTIFRTALALGWEAIFVIQGSADPYNDKALRASRGASLLLPWVEGSWDEAASVIQTSSHHVYIADNKGEPLSQVKFSKPLALVLGHETRGPSAAARAQGRPVMIPMKAGVESLNVASAASIFLYHIQQEIS